jgi:predicted RNA binding protein YcfA (HicA-like mRNA interferase family)
MSRFPIVSGKEVVKALGKIGFQVVSQKGSHLKMRRVLKNSKQTVIVPNHKEIKKGTLANGILRPINLSVEEFNKLL